MCKMNKYKLTFDSSIIEPMFEKVNGNIREDTLKTEQGGEQIESIQTISRQTVTWAAETLL